MNKATLISKLQFIINREVGLEFYFLYRKKSDDPIEILRANLEGSTTKTKLESVFINKIRHQLLRQNSENKTVADIPEWELRHIKDVDALSNTYYYFPNQEIKAGEEEPEDFFPVPIEFKEMPTLHGLKYENITLFEHEKHLLNDVISYLIRLQIDDEQVILYKHKSPIDILSRAAILKILGQNIKNHSTQFSLEQDTLLGISDRIDFIWINNNFVILNLPLLESKYGFNDRYLKKGYESLKLIKDSNILIDTNIFEELAKTAKFAKKLMKVKSGNEILKTPVAEMKSFLESFTTKDGKFSLAKRIKFNEKQGTFEVKTKVAADDFLRLLQDQYLISMLTKKAYISDSQTEFGNDEEVEKSDKVKKKATLKKDRKLK